MYSINNDFTQYLLVYSICFSVENDNLTSDSEARRSSSESDSGSSSDEDNGDPAYIARIKQAIRKVVDDGRLSD